MSEVSGAEGTRRRHELSEAATKKVFRRLIPFLLLMYIIAFLADRSCLSCGLCLCPGRALWAAGESRARCKRSGAL